MNTIRSVLSVFALLLASCPAVYTWSQEVPRVKAHAPEDHVELKDTLSGSYFIARPLKQEYDRLLSQLKALQADIEGARTSGPDALRELRRLQAELERLRREIEDRMVFVPVAKTHTQTEVLSFDLGPERCLCITADNVRIVGWDQPGVKCELEKTVLADGEDPPRDELTAIKVLHRHARAPDIVGRSRDEAAAEEERFLATPEGIGLTPEQRESRRKLLEEIQAAAETFRDFQGRQIDTLHVEGLSAQEGNTQMILEVGSPDGGASSRSVWRRHARITLYVPPCKALAVRGGTVALDVQDVQASLVITSAGSHERDYYREYKVRGLRGSLVAKDSPLHVVDDVEGDVLIVATSDFANSGTTHEGGAGVGEALRTFHFFEPLGCACTNVRGDFEARFVRVNLHLENVTGRIDVRNEFGDTTLVAAAPLGRHAHRVVSEAGTIELRLAPAALGELPLWAFTSCGSVRTNASGKLLQDFHVTVGRDAEGDARRWAGFRSPPARTNGYDAGVFLEGIRRPSAAYEGLDRPAGLDLVSRGGAVAVEVQP